MKLPEINPEFCFRLELSNNQVWNILSDGTTSEWTTEFASILTLPKSHKEKDAHSLTFYTTQTERADNINNKLVYVPENISYREKIQIMWSSILPIYSQAMSTGGIPLHAALIEYNCKGILLAAPGGTGKTTCCKRLPENWNALCDDETLLIPDNKGDLYKAHPFPTWSNFLLDRPQKSWNVKRNITVNSIFFLQQADSDRVEPLGQGNSAALIFQSATQICRRMWNRLSADEQNQQKSQLFNLAGNIAMKIPAFSLYITRDGKFWELIDSAIIAQK